MFNYFGRIIDISPYNDIDGSVKWDYECINNWVYIKEWFNNNLFTDEDFMI